MLKPLMRHLVAGVLAVTCSASVGGAATPPPTPAQVDTAIHKAIEFLYAQQKPDGRWEFDPTRIGGEKDENYDSGKMQGISWGGFTALSTYALLSAGESPTDPHIAKAIEFLKKADISGIYSIGLRAQVWSMIPPTEATRTAMHRDGTLLLKGVNLKDKARGFYHYITTPDGYWDLSVSQYAILGMWACRRQGFEVNDKYWQLVDEAWKKSQLPDGSWAYTPDKPASPSMTAAGVATLFIVQDELAGNDPGCRGNPTNANIQAGIKWMGDHFGEILRDDYYTWFGVERIGAASGIKYLGTHDWYAEGVAHMIENQAPNGEFNAYWGGNIGATSFALLFLSRGRASICYNKLAYDTVAAAPAKPVAGAAPVPAGSAPAAGATAAASTGHWNERPRDLANLVRWTGTQAEKIYNFQVVNLDGPVSELHDAPILYISGDQKVQLSEPQIAKLKQFVEEGGLIFANADCGSDIFTKSITELGAKMFPQYEFRALPPDHPIYAGQQFKIIPTKRPGNVRALTNGARELMVILTSADVSRAWQRNDFRSHVEQFQFGADLFQYAVDQTPMFRGETSLVNRDETIKTDKKLAVARLQYAGNWDPEPYGWRRLAAMLHNDQKLDITVDPIMLGDGKLAGHPLAHLTGTGKLSFKENQRAELKKFVEAGGVLVVDALNGDAEFADSAREELRTVFGDAAKTGLASPLASDDALYQIPGVTIDKFGYRNFARHSVQGNSKAPRIFGIRTGQRLSVLFSAEDLSTGLMGHPIDGIMGYSPQTATAIMRNIVLLASTQPPVAVAR